VYNPKNRDKVRQDEENARKEEENKADRKRVAVIISVKKLNLALCAYLKIL
jgi:hypothetical protein